MPNLSVIWTASSYVSCSANWNYRREPNGRDNSTEWQKTDD